MQNEKTPANVKIVIVIFLLHASKFYNSVFYQELGDILYIISTSFGVYFLYFFLKSLKRKCTKIDILVNAIYLMYWFTMFTGTIISNQSVYYCFKALVTPHLFWGFYYYLKEKNVSINYLKKIFLYFGIGYVVTLIICYLQYPHSSFGMWLGDEFKERLESEMERRGIYRFVLPYNSFCRMALLYLISNYKATLKNNLSIIFLIALSLFGGSRFPIVVTIFCAVIGYWIHYRLKIRKLLPIICVGGLAFFFLMNNEYTSKIIDNYITISEDQKDKNEENDDIRIQSATYFFIVFNNEEIVPIILGNGLPSGRDSKYVTKLHNLTKIGFYDVDVGYAGLYIRFGILGLLIIFIWAFLLISYKVPHEYLWVKMYVLYVMIAMFAGWYFYEDMVELTMLSYFMNVITQSQRKEKKELKFTNKHV